LTLPVNAESESGPVCDETAVFPTFNIPVVMRRLKMKKSMQVLMVLVTLGITFGCATVGLGQVRGGGWKEVEDKNDAGVVAAAEFAVSARKEQEGGPLSLVSIEQAERQVVAGIKYRICMKVKAADETDAGEESQDVRVEVFRSLQNKHTLNSWEEADCGGSGSDGHHAARVMTPADPITSVYSSLSKCKLVTTGQDSSTQACRGVGGYNLRLEYADVRESITVISPDGKKHPLEFWNVIGSGFSHVGQKAEWRVTKKNGKLVPVGLIVRFNVTDNSGDSPKEISYLAVAKITPEKSCVTDKISPSATANEEARRAADASADKPCLEPPSANHYSQPAPSVAGVYENFTVGEGSGDLEGMRVVIVQAGGGYHAIAQVAQGGAEDPQPEFVAVNVNGMSVDFTAGSMKYTGTVTPAGLRLKNADGATQTLKRKPCSTYFK
jgi:hypothetical protein